MNARIYRIFFFHIDEVIHHQEWIKPSPHLHLARVFLLTWKIRVQITDHAWVQEVADPDRSVRKILFPLMYFSFFLH